MSQVARKRAHAPGRFAGLLLQLLVSCQLSLVPGAHAATAQPGTSSNALTHFLDGLQTFSAGFEQVVENEFGEELERSHGVLYVERPGRFHWAYWEPFPQLIISDGLSLWIFDEDLEQVTVRDITESIDDSPAAVLGGEVDVEQHYVVIDGGTVEGVNWLELTPRDIESQYATVRLGFRNDHLAGMELFDNLGQKTRISFQDTRRNPPLEPGLFEFTPPEGVDVVDER